MRRYRLARVPAFAAAITIPIVVAAVSVLPEALIRRDVGLLVSVVLVLLVAWLGGIWPALISTTLLSLAMGGPLALEFSPPVDGWSIFLFASAALMGTAGIESLYRTRWRVEAARDRARAARRGEHAIRAELESIVAAIGDGIVVVEADDSISLMNQAAVGILGPDHSTFSALTAHLLPGQDGVSPTERLDGDAPATAEFRLPNGTRRIEISTFPLSDGEPGRRVILIRDVTEVRQRELLRDAFLSLLSHELRTPMTAVYGGATLMQRLGDKLDPATRNEIRADIVHEADRLSRLIDDLLVLTRVEEGVDVGTEPALLQHLATSVVQQDRSSLGGRPIEISIDPGLAPVTGDETGIRQVIHNLLSNAVKYSPPGSAVELRVEHGAGEVIVRVLDRGRGLTDDVAAHVFEPFYRSKAAKRTATGIGIGLYVSRRLVEAMGGRIWAIPRAGGGSEFGFALPEWPMEPEIDEPTTVSAGEAVT